MQVLSKQEYISDMEVGNVVKKKIYIYEKCAKKHAELFVLKLKCVHIMLLVCA